MGASLVGAVLARWTHVSDTAFRILTRMALTSLDNPNGKTPAATYWGGRDLLAMSLRRPWPEGDDEQAKKARRHIYGDVRRAIKELIKEGAVEIVETGRAVREGNRQVYRLCLLPLGQEGKISPPKEGEFSPPQRGESPSPEEGEFPARGGGDSPSQGEERTKEGTNEGSRVGDQSAGHRHPRKPSAHARERDERDDDENSKPTSKPRTPGPACPTCGTELDPDGSCFICRKPSQ